MKYIITILLLLPLVFNSCTEEDNKKDGTGLVGTWEYLRRDIVVRSTDLVKEKEMIDLINKEEIELDWLTFRENGTYYVGKIPHPSTTLAYKLGSEEDEFGRKQMFLSGTEPKATSNNGEEKEFCMFWQEKSSFIIFYDRTEEFRKMKEFQGVAIFGVIESVIYTRNTISPLK